MSEGPTAPVMRKPDRQCSCCHQRPPRSAKQAYCNVCHALKAKEWRAKHVYVEKLHVERIGKLKRIKPEAVESR